MRELFYGVTEQAKAGKHRMDDARALMRQDRWRGAMYLAGYSVECLLKAKLMQKFDCRHLRELESELQRRGVLPGHATVFTHQLEILIRLAQRLDRLRQNAPLWQDFNIANRWLPAWRYAANLSRREDAEDFLDAVEKLSRWIENNIRRRPLWPSLS